MPQPTYLEPDDTLAGLHGGVVKVPLLLLRVLDTNVHITLQALGLGLGAELGPLNQGSRDPHPQANP